MQQVRIGSGSVSQLLGDGVTADGEGAFFYKNSPWAAFQGHVEGSGAVTATITIHGSNDGVNYCETELGTITLSGTDEATDGFAYVGPFKYVIAVVSNVTGTDATVTCSMGY